jgi:16S rRNA (cytidine1402-2'-O)-methyltransferase
MSEGGATRRKSADSGVLWIVATPIGTLDDIAQRAIDVLSEVDIILAEDTRRTRKLLSHFQIPAGRRLKSYHKHNERHVVELAMEELAGGCSIALTSDAGTPVLSDPGFLLVAAAREHGFRVLSVPGPSAFTAALAASAQEPLPATLAGFLPVKGAARTRLLENTAHIPWTTVFLVSPHRLKKDLADLGRVLGEERPATLLAEISKAYERAAVGTLGELGGCSEIDHPRGEYVLVIGPAIATRNESVSSATVQNRYDAVISRGVDRKTALRTVAHDLGISRREVYSALLSAEKEL